MVKNDRKKVITASTTGYKIDQEKTKAIADELDRKSLKQYLRTLKQFEKTRKVYVYVPSLANQDYLKDLEKLFPDKEIIIEQDPSLLLGLRIVSEDDVFELNLKHKLDDLLNFIEADENFKATKPSQISGKDILDELDGRLAEYTKRIPVKFENIGFVEKNNDGVITASGLSKVTMGELVEFDTPDTNSTGKADKISGVVLNLSEDKVSIILLDSRTDIKEGYTVRRTGNLMQITVSDKLLGRVVDTLGNPLDGKAGIGKGTLMPLERIAAGVIDREPVNTPLKTGVKAIDTMLPIGRGQRELIIGDRGLGKTAIALDTIINQSKYWMGKQKTKGDLQPVICIYVAIGQKQSSVAQTIQTLRENGALDYTIIVSASSSSPASLQYLAPYAGTAIAEYFMEKGQDVLIVYDDLTKHAWAYRQLSLILQRPAGREAYPGDIFYLHSRLLERAVKLNKKNGGGSITALPIIETQASDISAYIPTNVISITDGQIYLEPSLFNIGVRPAINPGNSVSRVGGAAQTKAIKSVSGKLRLELAQYNSLAAFAQFGSELDDSTLRQLERGKRIVEILKQPQFTPLAEPLEIISIWSVTNGFLDDIPIESIQDFENQLHEYMLTHEPKLMIDIAKGDKLSEKVVGHLKQALENFRKAFHI